jgi:arsenate reductase
VPQVRLYGIANCDKVRAARSWLEQRGIAAEFHDFKRDGIGPQLLTDWLKQVDWTELVNRRGTTWKRLSDSRQAAITSDATARALMLEKPSVIKRPIMDLDGSLHLGFEPAVYSVLFGKA